MTIQSTKPNHTSQGRRWVLAALAALLPAQALAQQQQRAAPALPGGRRLRLDQLPPAVQNMIATCSTADKSCCNYSDIQGDLCCPDFKVGPTRANMTDAQFREVQSKFGNRKFSTSATPTRR
jgi:hypothetical protein